jgi:hypothetical protein
MTASQLLMIRPAAFGYNPEAAVNNAFQQAGNHGGGSARCMLAELFFDRLR